MHDACATSPATFFRLPRPLIGNERSCRSISHDRLVIKMPPKLKSFGRKMAENHQSRRKNIVPAHGGMINDSEKSEITLLATSVVEVKKTRDVDSHRKFSAKHQNQSGRMPTCRHFSRWWDAHRLLGADVENRSPWHCSRHERGALLMIDRGEPSGAGRVAAQHTSHWPGAGWRSRF